jgi:hypothetical protein
MISSAAEDSEDEDGSDVRSIQDSGYVELVSRAPGRQAAHNARPTMHDVEDHFTRI